MFLKFCLKQWLREMFIIGDALNVVIIIYNSILILSFSSISHTYICIILNDWNKSTI